MKIYSERERYRFDELGSTFSRSDKWDGGTLPLQLFTDVIGIQLQKRVVVVEESYHQNVCRQV